MSEGSGNGNQPLNQEKDTVAKLLEDANKLRSAQKNHEGVVLREERYIEGPRPDTSQLIAQHLEALRHVRQDNFQGHHLGVPLKPPPCPFDTKNKKEQK